MHHKDFYKTRKIWQRWGCQDQIQCVCVWLSLMSIHYSQLISIENLFQAWSEFKKGKKKRFDLQVFERYLEDNLFELQKALVRKTYKHGGYQSFYVHDPKKRHIHKASVEDRIIHHLLYRYLYHLFDSQFIYDSYSCRLGKGTHKAVDRSEQFTRKVSKNYIKPCWVLKCDVKKFFASVNQQILLHPLCKKIKDPDIIWLVRQVIDSFHSEFGKGKGIPLGNLTSQVFANVYLNELDQFIKQKMKVKYYIRYADDFLLISGKREDLERRVLPIAEFLQKGLELKLHPNKIILRNINWGTDFLGYIVLPHYRLPRTKTKRSIFKKLLQKIEDLHSGRIYQESFNQTIQSYLGFLKHANTYKLRQELKNQVGFFSYICRG